MSKSVSATAEGIALCPSRPHRCVLGLLRVALGHPADGDLLGDLKASDPQELVRISVFHYVHVVLSKAFENAPDLTDAVPHDLVIFFSEMRRANLRRNEKIKAQLVSIGAALSGAGLHGVALKGAAEMLAPVHADPAFRFLSDLDILVPEGQVDRAVALLRDLGAVSQTEHEINQRGHHHLEPLHHPDWPVPLELHLAFGPGVTRGVLHPKDVMDAARASSVAGLDLPAPAHRLAHMVLHAQFDPPRFRDGALSLRDAMEMEAMTKTFGAAGIAEAKALFACPEPRAAWEALDASRTLLFGTPDQFGSKPPGARAWARRALAAFGRPGRRRLAMLAHLSRHYARNFMFDRERRRHYLHQLARPWRLRGAIAYQRDKFRRNP